MSQIQIPDALVQAVMSWSEKQNPENIHDVYRIFQVEHFGKNRNIWVTLQSVKGRPAERVRDYLYEKAKIAHEMNIKKRG